MAFRDYFVRIAGKEEVSPEAQKAGGALRTLGQTAKSLTDSPLFRAVGTAALIAGMKKSVDAANELDASTRKLDATSRVTGISLDTLTSLAQQGKEQFKLATTLANEFAVSIGTLGARTGDTGKSQQFLAAYLDLSAAKGLNANEALDALNITLKGQDEGLDKLLGKNPSAIWKEYADAVGTTVGKMSDQQKLLSIQIALIEAGTRVGGEYVKYLDSAAGAQAQLTQELQATAATIGQAINPALSALLPLLSGLARFVGATVAPIITRAFLEIQATIDGIAPAFFKTTGDMRMAFGQFVVDIGRFLPFARDSIQEYGKALIGEGILQSTYHERLLKDIEDQKQKSWARVRGITTEGEAAVTSATVAGATTRTSVSAEELAKRSAAEEKQAKELKDARDKWNKETLAQLEGLGKYLGKENQKQADDAKGLAEVLATQLQVNLGKASADALTITTAAMEKLLTQLRGKIPVEQWAALNTELQNHKHNLADLLPPTESLAEAAKEAADANKQYGEGLKTAKKSTEELVRDSGTLARSFVDAASATGLIDAKMASILNSSISLATNIGKAFGGDPTAIAASVTSLANIIVGLGSSEVERKRAAAYASNTTALDKLTREVGNLNLRESGKTFAGIQTAVDASVQARADARAAGKGPGEADNAAKAAFLKSLQSQGIGLDEARALFKELFGRDLALANSGTFFQDITAFSEGLKNTEFGQFGSDYASQLDAVIKGFDIFDVSDADNKLQEFKALASKFSPALGAALAGDLSTPEGRAQAAKNLQDLFTKLRSGGLSPEEIGVSGSEFLSLIGTILPLIAEANGSLASGDSAASVSSAGMSPLGAPGLPTSTFGFGVPNITGSIVPAPNSTTTINGGVNVTLNIDGARDPREVADEVLSVLDEYLGARYDSIRAAQGAVTQVGA